MNVTTMPSIHPSNAYTQNSSFQSAPNLSTFPLQPQALAIDISVAIGPIAPQTSSFLNNSFMNPNPALINPQTNNASFRPSFLNPIPQVANTNANIASPSRPTTGFVEIQKFEELQRMMQKISNDMTQLKLNQGEQYQQND